MPAATRRLATRCGGREPALPHWRPGIVRGDGQPRDLPSLRGPGGPRRGRHRHRRGDPAVVPEIAQSTLRGTQPVHPRSTRRRRRRSPRRLAGMAPGILQRRWRRRTGPTVHHRRTTQGHRRDGPNGPTRCPRDCSASTRRSAPPENRATIGSSARPSSAPNAACADGHAS